MSDTEGKTEAASDDANAITQESQDEVVTAAAAKNTATATGDTAKNDTETANESMLDKHSEQSSEKPSEKGKTDTSSVNSVYLGERIEIFPDRPKPQYDMGEIKAFAAEGTGEKEGDHFALICERHLIPRTSDISMYRALINNAAIQVISAGVVHWPGSDDQRFVIVYSAGLGRKLIADDKPAAMGWKQDAVMTKVLRPLVGYLEDLNSKDFFHGNIHAGNVFAPSKEDAPVILGDCLAGPVSFLQPSIYLTIERAATHPLARGRGTVKDDLYALGVLLVVLMRANDPLAGKTEGEVIKEKILQGSYNALTGKDKFKGSILELVRGLLHDNPRERWSIEEVLMWMDGQRLSPKQVMQRKKASRPISFMKNKYYNAASLALDLTKNKEEALQLIDSGELTLWIQRSLEDKEMLEKFEMAMFAAKDASRGAAREDQLISATASVLDNWGPLHYKEFSMTGDGVGTLLAASFVKKEDLSPFSGILSKAVILNWLTTSENPSLDVPSLFTRFEACRNYVSQMKRAGFGLERCLYHLAPQCHCLSETVEKYYVRTPEDLMMAYEDLCRKGKAPTFFLDRHSIAFLCVKEMKTIDFFLNDLNSKEEHTRILANLKTLAALQNRFSLPSFPAIAKVFLKMLPVVYSRYHDVQVREKLEKNIRRYAQEGDLVKMAGILDNADVVQKDFLKFRKAMKEYKDLNLEYLRLEKNLANKETFGMSTGASVAALVSCGLSALIILFLVVNTFSLGF